MKNANKTPNSKLNKWGKEVLIFLTINYLVIFVKIVKYKLKTFMLSIDFILGHASKKLLLKFKNPKKIV